MTLKPVNALIAIALLSFGAEAKMNVIAEHFTTDLDRDSMLLPKMINQTNQKGKNTMNTQEITDYEKQAEDFLKSCNATLTTEKLGTFPYFDDEETPRDVYLITIVREGKDPWKFRFGQSLRHSQSGWEKEYQKLQQMGEPLYKILKAKKGWVQSPSAYTVLASIEKYDVGTFEDFCSNFGYDMDSRKAEKTYFAVQKEASECQRVFGDVIEQLQEIN